MLIKLILIFLACKLLVETTPYELNHDSLSQIGNEFESKMKNVKLKSKLAHKSRFSTHLDVSFNAEDRHERLTRFLAEKIFQYSEKINLMSIPELRHNIFDINLIKLDTENVIETNKFGSSSCRLDKVANSTIVWKLECENIFKLDDRKCKWKKDKSQDLDTLDIVVPIPVCPWHWNIVTRKDRFPFKRASSVCNCIHCQAKTIYDSRTNKVSFCQPQYVLMPVLVRKSINEDIERWKFYLEEVATSCACSLNRLKPVV